MQKTKFPESEASLSDDECHLAVRALVECSGDIAMAVSEASFYLQKAVPREVIERLSVKYKSVITSSRPSNPIDSRTKRLTLLGLLARRGLSASNILKTYKNERTGKITHVYGQDPTLVQDCIRLAESMASVSDGGEAPPVTTGSPIVNLGLPRLAPKQKVNQ